MSYLRYGSVLKYVEGYSEDYIFLAGDGKGSSGIEDYGKLHNESILELLFRHWKTEKGTEYELLKEHVLNRLAANLNIKIRDRPLTTDEEIEISIKRLKEFEESTEFKNFNLNLPYKIPPCPICGKLMVNAIDSITKETNKYEWKTTCGHCKDLIISIG